MLPRYQRREAVVDEALRKVFLCGVSTRQAGQALAGLLDEAVSAATVSTVAKALDESVGQWHRRKLIDSYQHLILDGVSVRLRLVGKVERRMVLCALGDTTSTVTMRITDAHDEAFARLPIRCKDSLTQLLD